jgi:hypothetical protein
MLRFHLHSARDECLNFQSVTAWGEAPNEVVSRNANNECLYSKKFEIFAQNNFSFLYVLKCQPPDRAERIHVRKEQLNLARSSALRHIELFANSPALGVHFTCAHKIAGPLSFCSFSHVRIALREIKHTHKNDETLTAFYSPSLKRDRNGNSQTWKGKWKQTEGENKILNTPRWFVSLIKI